jgi:hypothetical protein
MNNAPAVAVLRVNGEREGERGVFENSLFDS